MDAARLKMASAFEFVDKLGAPFFSFHDIDIAPAGADFAETCRTDCSKQRDRIKQKR